MPITKEILKNYPNQIFIECGSGKGNGIQAALDAGFEEIHSIEIDPQLYNDCKNRFYGNDKVDLYLGDSINILSMIMPVTYSANATFWLDAHPNAKHDPTGLMRCPLLAELAIIFGYGTEHTILIDDIRLCGRHQLGHITKQQIIDVIYAANPFMQIEYIDGHTKQDILVYQDGIEKEEEKQETNDA